MPDIFPSLTSGFGSLNTHYSTANHGKMFVVSQKHQLYKRRKKVGKCVVMQGKTYYIISNGFFL